MLRRHSRLNRKQLDAWLQALPNRTVRSDLTIAFKGQLYSLTGVWGAEPGGLVRAAPVSGSQSIRVEVRQPGCSPVFALVAPLPRQIRRRPVQEVHS